MRKRLLLRLALIAAILGGIYYWQETKRPVDMNLTIDVSAARPREITGVDIIVRRNDRPLSRHEMVFGNAGSPPRLEFVVHAPPGGAEVESTLNYQGKPSRRVTVQMKLKADSTNEVRIE
jgi:hypothetical protein